MSYFAEILQMPWLKCIHHGNAAPCFSESCAANSPSTYRPTSTLSLQFVTHLVLCLALYWDIISFTYCCSHESEAKHEWGWGWKAGTGEGQKKKEIADISNYRTSSGGLTFPVEISQCHGSENSVLETYSS